MDMFVYPPKEQNEDRQLIALQAFPVSERNIYMDKLSGKDFNRPQYRKLLKKFRPGDLLVIKSIDPGWPAIMRRYCCNGELLPKKSRLMWWCWICRFLDTRKIGQ